MKKNIKSYSTTISTNDLYEGEPLKAKILRMLENNEPITEVLHAEYTDKKFGVLPGFDIRTDRFEVAREAADKMYQAAEANEIAKNGKESVDNVETPEDESGKKDQN